MVYSTGTAGIQHAHAYLWQHSYKYVTVRCVFGSHPHTETQAVYPILSSPALPS